jgi:hypothetical protein
MAARREDVDLWLVLGNPGSARKYVEGFDWKAHFEEVPRALTTAQGRRIQIDSMTDEEAVVLAMELLRDYEMRIVMAEFNKAEALGEIC